MSRLLVIANLYHSSPRIPSLISRISASGWDVSIVTPPLSSSGAAELGLPEGFDKGVAILGAPHRGDIFRHIRRVLRAVGFNAKVSYTEQLKDALGGGGRANRLVTGAMRLVQAVFAIPDTEWPWFAPAYKRARLALLEQHYDVILSSSPFPTVHRIAAKLKGDFNCIWVADFRDPWSQSHNATLPKIRQRFDLWLEEKTLRRCDLITTVSKGFADKLKKIHAVPIAVIPNGYEPVRDTDTVDLPSKFTITYTGTVYNGKQNPELILSAIRNLLSAALVNADSIDLRFYGRYDSSLQSAINKFGLQSVARQLGQLPRSEARRKQRGSHLSLVLQWEDISETGIFPLKFYECLAARRPILLTGGSPQSELANVLTLTGAGSVSTTDDSVQHAILKYYNDYLNGDYHEHCGSAQDISTYSVEARADELKVELEKLVMGRKEVVNEL